MLGLRSRDDFSAPIKQRLAARAGHRCSNPSCSAPTSGPQLRQGKAVNVGVAAHISGASEGGPRYADTLSAALRSGIENGIWLCQNCAKLIDNDEDRYPDQLLQDWKLAAEQDAHRKVGKSQPTRSQVIRAERALRRDLQLRDKMRRDLVKPWAEIQRGRDANRRERPYDKFRCNRLIIHQLGDDTYPVSRDGPGISPWFRIEPFDFYHGGIKFVLRIDAGVIENESDYAGHLHWAIIPYGADFDRERFKRVSIWRLGLIPYRNIRHYDPDGDEHYSTPHLYCDFNENGEPYEKLEYAIVGGDEEYDWPLNAELQIPARAVLSAAPENQQIEKP